MSETVDNEELEKNFMIKTLLDNLHSTDRDLENTIVDAADGEKLKNEEIAHRIIGQDIHKIILFEVLKTVYEDPNLSQEKI